MSDMTIGELISAYWDCAYREGQEGRTHDTPDGEAQRLRSQIDAHLAKAGEPAQPLEAVDGSIKMLSIRLAISGLSGEEMQAWNTIRAAIAHPRPTAEPIPRIEANFGRGEIAITTGTHGGRPCVYLAPARVPAAVGTPVSNAAEGLPTDAMREDESVLTFPTKAQADLVKLALAGQLPTGEQAGEVVYPNGCDKTVPAALRFLADNERPRGGEDRFNAAHLYQLAQEIERALAQPRSAGVPDGWKLVPVKPTQEMVEASYGYYGPGAYLAMLAAAPAPGKECG